MAITPNDIQNKQFERAFRGYEIEDVDDFLDQIAKDLEQLIRENTELKDQVDQLQDKNKSYHKMEETMHNAIVVAQETADEVKQNAKREAELIRKEAEREARQIVEDARYRVSRLMGEHEELLKRARVFKMRFRSFMESQLVALETDDWMEEQKPDKRPVAGSQLSEKPGINKPAEKETLVEPDSPKGVASQSES
jgi:cell division initiation protein